MVAKQSKKMYSISNMEGTYSDMTDWINELLRGDRQEISRYELINFLNSKGRVPSAIMKKNRPPRTEQPKCIARILKDHSQCKNDSEQGDNCFCKIHTIRPARWTINDTVEDIELTIEEERKIKKAKSKADREKKKKEKSDSSSDSDSVKSKKVMKRRKRVAKKAVKTKRVVKKEVIKDDSGDEIDFGEEDKKVVVKTKKVIKESGSDSDIDFGEEDSLPPTQDSDYDDIDFN